MCDEALNNPPTLLDNSTLQQSYGLLGGGRIRFRTLIVGDGRLQGFVFAAALAWAVILLVLATEARGESAANPGVDDDPAGAPYVAGELLVSYEQGTSEETEAAVVRRSGARTLQDLPGETRLVSYPEIRDEASGAAREQALAQELRDLGQRANVEAADYNYIRRPSFVPNDPKLDNQWGLTRTRFPGAWNDSKGRGARVAIVDSGAASGHPDVGKIVAQKDFVEGNAVADDDFGHGTRVTGIAGAITDNGKGVAGACFKCGLLIAKVMNGNGAATDARIVKGIDWSMDHGADVVNLSLGGPADSDVLRTEVNRATNRSDGLAYFSSRGDWVDLAAPGAGILSTRAVGGYGTRSGTSYSAPFVSGLAGLLASQGKSAYAIRQRMQDTAVDLGPAGRDPRFGHGRINADNAVR